MSELIELPREVVARHYRIARALGWAVRPEPHGPIYADPGDRWAISELEPCEGGCGARVFAMQDPDGSAAVYEAVEGSQRTVELEGHVQGRAETRVHRCSGRPCGKAEAGR